MEAPDRDLQYWSETTIVLPDQIWEFMEIGDPNIVP